MIAWSDSRNEATGTVSTANSDVTGGTIYYHAAIRSHYKNEFAKLLNLLKQLAKIHDCQWILRFRVRLDVPKIPREVNGLIARSGFVIRRDTSSLKRIKTILN